MPEETYVGKVGAVKDAEGNITTPEQSFSAQYDFPETTEELVAKYNDGVVRNAAVQSLKTSLLRVIRTAGGVENATTESVQAAVDAWIPGVITRKPKDHVGNAMDAFAHMSDDQKAAFLQTVKDDLQS